MSLNREASFVRNQIAPYITNTHIDINMIKDDIIATKNRVVFEYDKKQMLQNSEQLYAEITCIPLVCRDISECCGVDSDEKVLVADIPETMNISTIPAIRYVGTIDRLTPFNVVSGLSYLYRKYAKWTSNMKTVWYRKTKNQLIFLSDYFAVPPNSITVELIPQNEQDLLRYECACIDTDDVEYRCPDYLIDVVRGKVVDSWLRQYNIAHSQANTQSEILSKKL
jgi:hypothetical protein